MSKYIPAQYLGDQKILDDLPAERLVDLDHEVIWSAQEFIDNPDLLGDVTSSGAVTVVDHNAPLTPQVVAWRKTDQNNLGYADVVLDAPRITMPILQALANARVITV